MFFLASKIFWILAAPLNFLWILILIGLVYGIIKHHQINKILFVALWAFIILGALPVGYNLVVLIERQYQRPVTMPDNVDGIMVLGGGFNAELSHMTGMMVANNDINRVVDFVDLAQKYPEAKLVYSGGSGRIFHQGKGESPIAAAYLRLSALDEGRVVYEEASRNTYENIVNTKKMVAPQKGEVWIVVTSKFHIPRTMGIFKKQEWDVTPYPSSPITTGEYRILPVGFNVSANFKLLDTGLREVFGCVIYYIFGKSAFVLPLSPLKSEESA